MDAPWCHFLTLSTRLHLRPGCSCWPGAEDEEEPAEQETSDSGSEDDSGRAGVCHRRQQRGRQAGRRAHTWARSCPGRPWVPAGWGQPSITPVSPGQGDEPVPCPESPRGVEAGTGMGSTAGTGHVEQGVNPPGLPPAPSARLSPNPSRPTGTGGWWRGASPSQGDSIPSDLRDSCTTACSELKAGMGREVI